MALSRKHAFLVVLASALLLGRNVAAGDNGSKIGFVDVKGVTERSTTIQAVVRSAEEKLRGKQDEMEAQLRNFKQTKQNLDARKAVMAEEELRKQTAQLDDMRDKLDTMQRTIDKELRRTETDVMGPAVDRIIEAVKKIGKAQGYDLVLTKDIVIFGAETCDLTPLVVQELDKNPPPAASAAAPAPAPENPAKGADATAPKSKTPPAKPKGK